MKIEATASEMYAELRATLALPKVRDAYRTYSRVLRVATDQKTDFDTLHLGSLYAKLDYLTREYRLDRSLARMTNDTRVRLRTLLAITDEELELCRLVDLKSICLLIAVLYKETVPADLRTYFPSEPRRAHDSSVVADYIRLYVTRWDDAFVYGRCEELPDDEEVRVCYYYTGGFGNGDNRYLRPYLYKGVQINMVRPQLYQGVYYPELIILDPDYLIDITSVTACFEEYAHDARLHLLAKLRQQEDTEAIMLGNLAGQLLDEEVHGADCERPFAESYADFMRCNAFKALTTKTETLFADGEKQQTNIRKAIREGLKKRLGHFDSEQVVLEPSFVCEMLGLQGRMDMLQQDYRVLIEQKSGKGQWYPGYRDSLPPREQLKHRVQLLLYQAILHYNMHIANRDMQLLLLYSKYEQSLIAVTPAPQLLFEAIRLRNEIAGWEARCCRGGMRQLEMLDAAQMRQLEVKDKFWESYVLPGLKSVLDPILQASPLERAYVMRFMTFLSNEHTLAKVGNKTKESSGFASKWHDSLEEKYQTGNIYDQLILISPDTGHTGNVTELVFAFAAERATEMSNFRVGDIVIAYQYQANHEPDVRRSMVVRGTIADVSGERLTIALRAPQSPQATRDLLGSQRDGNQATGEPVGKTMVYWAVEHDFMEAGYKSLYSGMHAFLSAPKERRDLLLLQRRPEVDVSRSLKGSYGSFDTLALHVKQAKDFFLIIGPPGTGKTSYGMLYTLQEQLREPGSQVLVTSFTNRAVDEVCGKLMEEGIDFIRLGNTLSCSPEYRDHVLSVRMSQAASRAEMREILQETRVIVGTTTTLSASLPLFKIKTFDLAIIDEASQILEPHLMGLLSACGSDGKAAIRKFVMIGDHKQLPAVVQQRPEVSRVEDSMLNGIGLMDCRLSLFERLLTRYRGDAEVVYMLTRQGRMHRDIADFPNRMFYGGRLQVVPLEHQEELLEMPQDCVTDDTQRFRKAVWHRVSFVDVPVVEPVIADKVNKAEAACMANLIMLIVERERSDFDPLKTLGVIVPYRNQIAAIRNAIERESVEQGLSEQLQKQLHDITIDTVERYQGSQRDYILYGFTIQRPYQLNFLANNTFEEDGMTIDRKLNVAMTRARKHLVMIGDSQVIGKNELFGQLLRYVKEKGGYL